MYWCFCSNSLIQNKYILIQKKEYSILKFNANKDFLRFHRKKIEFGIQK